jgi:hypothetical protein
MKSKKDPGQVMGIAARVVPIVFWLYVGGVGLMALFQAMPAAGYLRQKGQRGPAGGDRYVS